MKITSKKMNRLVLIKVEGSLVTEQVKQLEKEICAAFHKDNNIVIDFKEL